MSNLGLEWLYRLTSEPKRLWKRYLIEDLPFFWLILQQKINLYYMQISEKQSCELENNLTRNTDDVTSGTLKKSKPKWLQA